MEDWIKNPDNYITNDDGSFVLKKDVLREKRQEDLKVLREEAIIFIQKLKQR